MVTPASFDHLRWERRLGGFHHDVPWCAASYDIVRDRQPSYDFNGAQMMTLVNHRTTLGGAQMVTSANHHTTLMVLRW